MPEKGKDNSIGIYLPDFSPILGCCVGGSDWIHVGLVFSRITACGRPMGDVLMHNDIVVNCPDCVAEIRYRREHPEAAQKQLGIVTHK